jgi:hypothetical protein
MALFSDSLFARFNPDPALAQLWVKQAVEGGTLEYLVVFNKRVYMESYSEIHDVRGLFRAVQSRLTATGDPVLNRGRFFCYKRPFSGWSADYDYTFVGHLDRTVTARLLSMDHVLTNVAPKRCIRDYSFSIRCFGMTFDVLIEENDMATFDVRNRFGVLVGQWKLAIRDRVIGGGKRIHGSELLGMFADLATMNSSEDIVQSDVFMTAWDDLGIISQFNAEFNSQYKSWADANDYKRINIVDVDRAEVKYEHGDNYELFTFDGYDTDYRWVIYLIDSNRWHVRVENKWTGSTLVDQLYVHYGSYSSEDGAFGLLHAKEVCEMVWKAAPEVGRHKKKIEEIKWVRVASAKAAKTRSELRTHKGYEVYLVGTYEHPVLFLDGKVVAKPDYTVSGAPFGATVEEVTNAYGKMEKVI